MAVFASSPTLCLHGEPVRPPNRTPQIAAVTATKETLPKDLMGLLLERWMRKRRRWQGLRIGRLVVVKAAA